MQSRGTHCRVGCVGSAIAGGDAEGSNGAALQALLNLARAAHVARRGRAWHELLNCARHTWNAARALLNTDQRLLRPPPACVWEAGAQFPQPPAPPLSMLQPPGKDAGGKGGAKGGAVPAAAKAADPKARGRYKSYLATAAYHCCIEPSLRLPVQSVDIPSSNDRGVAQFLEWLCGALLGVLKHFWASSLLR
jgi:hypothetical protein